jgi:hypothetical protein
MYEGAKVNLNHPKADPRTPRDYQDRMGVLRNVRLADDSAGVFADFHFNPKHPVSEQLLWDAEHAPENVGFSHNVEAKVSRDKAGKVVVEEIVSVQSVDLVADPATTRGLFEHIEHNEGESMNLQEITLDQLSAGRADLVEQLQKAAVKTYLEGEDAKKQAAELKTLRERVDGYEAAAKLAEKKAGIDKLVEAAKLPKELVTEVFRTSLYEARDDAAVKALIEDRKVLAGKFQGRPQSREQQAAEGAVTAPDSKAFVEAIT